MGFLKKHTEKGSAPPKPVMKRQTSSNEIFKTQAKNSSEKIDPLAEARKRQIEEGHKIVDKMGKNKILTVLDKLIYIIRDKGGKVTMQELVKELKYNKKIVEFWAKILEKEDLLELRYPINIFSDPTIKLKKMPEPPKKSIELPAEKTLVENYNVTADFVRAQIKIWITPYDDVPIYEIIIPGVGEATSALLNQLTEELALSIPINIEDISDQKKIAQLKHVFFSAAKEKIKRKLPKIDDNYLSVLSGILMHNMYGLGEIEIIMADNFLEEVAINNSNVPVSVYHIKHGWMRTTKFINSEEEIYNFASQIGRKVGRQINSLNPIMDAHLVTGDRVAATLFPISTAGNTITIRRFARNPWTIVHLIDPKVNTLSPEIASFLWLAVQYELNVLVAGGTASGKTSLLNSISATIPANQRMISIEDTREIYLPKDLHWNWVPMTSRKANPEGQGEVSMLDLMVASLRMRPDRIIVGEIRTRTQAEALFETMHTGHAVYTTMHADTVEQVRRRLVEPPISIPKSELAALHLAIVQYRDRRKGVRRTLELAEILTVEGPGGEMTIDFNYLYRWRPRTDTFEKINESIRVIEELNMHTGMTTDEIRKDLDEKQMILKWMLENNIKDVNQVGRVMKLYYKNPDLIINATMTNRKPDFLGL